MRLTVIAMLVLGLSMPVADRVLAQAARPAQAPVRIELADRIVAVVNKEVITAKELEQRVERVAQQLRRQGAPLPPPEVLQRQVLERMITDLVQVQFAKETGATIDEAQLGGTLARIAQQANLSLPEFRRALERDGLGWDKFRDDVRSEMLISRLREREVDSKIQVSEAEIDAFLEEARSAPGRPRTHAQDEHRSEHTESPCDSCRGCCPTD